MMCMYALCGNMHAEPSLILFNDRFVPYFRTFFNHLLIFVCVCVCLCAMTCTWRSQNNLREFFFSFHYVVSKDQTQVIRTGSKCLYPLSNLNSLSASFKDYIYIHTYTHLHACMCVFCLYIHLHTRRGQQIPWY